MKISVSDVSIEQYDVIIVGSGPAGSVLADRLSDGKKRCLIIETGKTRFDTDIQRDSASMAGYGHYNGTYWPMHWIRAFGGTSAIWAGYVATLDDRDFASWPIKGPDLAPYYAIATEIMQRDASLLTYSAPDIDGFVHKPFSIPTESNFRVATRYSNFLSGSGNVDVLCESTVTELLVNEARTRVTGVSISTRPDIRTKLKFGDKQTLVLAAGGMGNAQLMLAPTEDSMVGVGNESDMAGRCLMEHPHFNDVGRAVLAKRLNRPAPPAKFGDFVDAIVPNDKLYEKVGNRSVSIEISEVETNENDPTERFLIRKFGPAPLVRRMTIRSEMHPNKENRVVLTDELDPTGLPRIKASCVLSSEDFRAANTCLTIMGEHLAKTDTGRVRIDNEGLFRDVTGGGHTMGTTRMGTDPASSVVDKNCRAHKYQNLYVAGSSLFTTGGASNPTLTIAALSARLADHLLGAA